MAANHIHVYSRFQNIGTGLLSQISTRVDCLEICDCFPSTQGKKKITVKLLFFIWSYLGKKVYMKNRFSLLNIWLNNTFDTAKTEIL